MKCSLFSILSLQYLQIRPSAGVWFWCLLGTSASLYVQTARAFADFCYNPLRLVVKAAAYRFFFYMFRFYFSICAKFVLPLPDEPILLLMTKKNESS